jgi:UDP-glucose 6-dehydrogenase
MRISVAGTDYVSLIAIACLVKNGYTVICIDNDKNKIAMLS